MEENEQQQPWTILSSTDDDDDDVYFSGLFRSVGNVLLDLTGGTFSLTQQIFLASTGDGSAAIVGNVPKFALAIITLVFDILFVFQVCGGVFQGFPIHPNWVGWEDVLSISSIHSFLSLPLPISLIQSPSLQHFVFYRGLSPTVHITDSRRKGSLLESTLPFSSRWPMEDQYLTTSEYSHLPQHRGSLYTPPTPEDLNGGGGGGGGHHSDQGSVVGSLSLQYESPPSQQTHHSQSSVHSEFTNEDRIGGGGVWRQDLEDEDEDARVF